VSSLAAALTAAGLLLCGQGLPALAAPAAQARAAHARPAVASATAGARAMRRLLLINGDRLAIRSSNGRQAIAVIPAARPDPMVSLKFGGQVTEIPLDAVPYLGRGLSPALFQLSALKKAESGGRLPVRVTFAGHRPSIPGLTVTGSSAGAATGYLTTSSARTFGAALQRQYNADHAAARFGTDGLFGHSVSISLADAAVSPAPATRPAFKMHTLTIRGRNLAGKADTGDDVFIASADNVARFDGLAETDNFFYHGAARFSVPAGHYWALATFFTGNSIRLVVVPQFTVSGQHSTLRIAEKSASSKVTMPTPRPAQNFQTTFEVVRGARHGGSFSNSLSWDGSTTGWVSPTTRKPAVGTLHTYTSATLMSPDHVTPGYAYNLDFPGPAGIVPPQHFAVAPGDLATVSERYYQDVPAKNAGWLSFGGTVAQLQFEFAEVATITMPQVQTQYFSADHRLWWGNETFTNLNQFAFGDFDDYRTYAGGQQQTQDWNRYPLHPAADTSLGGAANPFLTQTSAARVGNTLVLGMTPFSDNMFGHLGPGFFGNGNARVTGSYQVDENGREIAHGSALNGIPGIKLSASPSVVKFTLNAARSSKFYRLSPSSQTVWTWRSMRDTSARVPAGWFCTVKFEKNRIVLVRQCAVQNLMALNYRVRGMSLGGLTRPGAQVIDVTAGHIQLGGSASITGATAQVSWNDGDSWQPAMVTTSGGGPFRVTYDAPPGVDVSLRISATDSAGASIRETILRAYGVSL
jgi:hypothetical protein